MEVQDNNRRDFLKIGAALATTVVSWSAKSYAAIPGANDRVRVGVVGFGDRMKRAGSSCVPQRQKDMNFEIVAVSDIWSRRREEGAAYIQKLNGPSRRCETTTSCMHEKISTQ